MRDYPYPMADGVRSIVLGIIFTILTCGIYHILRAMPHPLGWEQLGRSLCSPPKHVH